MKISNSKKQLAKIISENGGWREGYSFSSQDGSGAIHLYELKPIFKSGGIGFGHGGGCYKHICSSKAMGNWHQTIVSREEYFHLYPAQDADGWIEWKGGECPVAEGTTISIRHRDGEEFPAAFALGDWNVRWTHDGKNGDVVAYRLRKQEHPNGIEPTSPFTPAPTLEQLSAEYRNRQDYADRKQQEADEAKAEAEAKLADLVAAGKAVGLVVRIAAPESELIITDWRDLQVGDEVECLQINITGGDYADDRIGSTGVVVATEEPGKSGQAVKMRFDDGKSYWVVKWRFIRRPAKGDANA